MNQKTVGLTLRAVVIALALILVAGPALPLLDGVAFAQSAAPTNLTASARPDGSAVDLSWDAVSGADSYEVWKKEKSATDWDAVESVTTNAYTHSPVTGGTTYGYYVRAVAGGTAGAWSSYVEATVSGGTAAPTGKPTLAATPDGLTGVDLSWSSVPGATSYDLRRWNGDTNSWDSIGNNPTGTSYDDDGLSSGQTYYYVIRAVNAGGNGPWSSEGGVGYASAELTATTTVPELMLTHQSRTTVVLSWTPVAGDSPIYTLQRQLVTVTDGAAAVEAAYATLADDLTGTTFTDANATFVVPTGDDGDRANDSTMYRYRVQAVVGGLQGDWSKVKSVTIPHDDARPVTPSSLTVTVAGPTSLNVEWSVVAGTDSYIRWKVGEGNWSDRRKQKPPFVHTGLRPETKYTYQVQSENINGPSDWSGEKSATTPATTSAVGQLQPPTGLTAVDTTKADGTSPGIKLSWNKATDATSYEVARWDNGADAPTWALLTLADADQSSRTHTDSTAAAGGSYYYVVRSVDNNGTEAETTDDDRSDWSAPVLGTVKATKPAAPPAGLKAESRGMSEIWVSWSSVEGASEYWLEWRRLSGGWTRITQSGTTYLHQRLAAGTRYQYRVKASNSGGQSDWSAENGADTDASQLATPTGLTAVDATDGTTYGVKLTWNAVSGATGYEIQKWDNTEATRAWRELTLTDDNISKRTHTDLTAFADASTATAGATYHYIIRATSGSTVKSPWSSPVTGMTKHAQPTGPTLTLVPTGQTMVRLTWTAVAGATSYEVEYIEGSTTAGFTTKTTLTRPASPRLHVHTGLKPGTLYTYRVRAVLPLDVKSQWSDTTAPAGQIVTRPSNPSLTAAAVSDRSIRLKWTVVSIAGATGGLTTADGYQLERRAAGETNWTRLTVTIDPAGCPDKMCTFTDTGTGTDHPIASTLYYYRIRATNDPTDSHTGAVMSYWDYANQRTPATPN